MFKIIARSLLIATLAAGSALADVQPGAADNTAKSADAAAKKTIHAKFPESSLLDINKLPYGNLYEVVADGEAIFYTDDKASFIFHGSLFDGKTQRNLTELKMRELTKAQFDKLPFDSAIKVVKGNGKRVLAVFSDVDCPFCKRLEDELAKVSDVTVYTFLYPIDSLHPKAAQKSKTIWCAPDRAKAWNDLLMKGIEPKNAGACDNPVAKNVELGAKLGVSGTPTLFFADGRRVPGAIPAEKLEKYLNGK
ncbi:MAG: DsbC family protein [Sulfuricellaceae bacterium]